MKRLFFILTINLMLIVYSSSLLVTEIHVAVADNFLAALQGLQDKFEKTSGHKLLITADTTDQLYAQIKAGKDFDVLLAANNQTPLSLIQQGQAVTDSNIIYAVSKLVLWSPQPYMIDSQGRILTTNKFKKLALPDPQWSPYGAAAQQTLQKFGLWDKLHSKLVMGNTISQTFQWIKEGKAELGFISLSQLAKLPHQSTQWSMWVVPPHLYTPLEHTAVLLKRAEHNVAAQDFMDFLQRAIARAIIEDFGYQVY